MNLELSDDNMKNSADDKIAKIEKAVVVGLNCGQGDSDLEEAERSLTELKELFITAGGEVAASVLQNRQTIDKAWFIGRGKLDEIAAAAKELQADTLVFDDELSGSQIRNIEDLTGLKVLDRTFVILDIFAGRAKTREGKLQVELAQLQYRSSRLIGTGKALSRLGGGIGTRGPGETKLETDRRHISRRIAALKRSLGSTRERRERTRQQRHNNEAITAAIVGYTNAGKSSLMNALCSADLETADQVFATLDPVARKLELPDGQLIILIDTVGFIRKLPHHLIDAFRSTLEEVSAADFIIHVTDASDPQAIRQIDIVHELLDQLQAINKPRIHVLNKIDLLLDEVPKNMLKNGGDVSTIEVSAKTGKGLNLLREKLAEAAGRDMIPMKLLIPYDKSSMLTLIRDNGVIDEIEYLNTGTKIHARVRSSVYGTLTEFILLAE